MADDWKEYWNPYKPELSKVYEDKGLWSEMFTKVFDQRAQRFWDREALVGGPNGEERYTYGDIKLASDRLALHFLDMGLKKGERVIVQLPNICEFVFIWIALQKIGVIPVMCLPQHRFHEISQIAAKAEAVGYFVAGFARKFNYHELVDEVAKAVPSIRYKVSCGKEIDVPGDYYDLRTFLRDKAEERVGAADELRAALPDPHDVGILLLSGGTTGTPKLIPREYNAYVHIARESSWELGYNMYTIQLAIAPVAHNMVLAAPGIQGAFYFGGKVVMCPSTQMEDICRTIEREKVTHIPMVPTMIIKMLNYEERKKYDLSSWKIVVNGASKLEPASAQRVEKELPCRLISQFGMSEGTITNSVLGDPDEIVHNTIGMCCSAADEWKILDTDTGAVIAESDNYQNGDFRGTFHYKGKAGVPGEIVFRGPYTIRGYYNEPEHNKRSITADGYYRSGDIACVHESGHGFIIMGRIKDAINRGGEKFSCEEVENIILDNMPNVHNAGLVAMPDPVFIEKACLFISLKDKSKPYTLEDVQAACEKGGLTKFKWPERLEIRDELPETNIGKVNKKELKAEIKALIEAGK